MRLGAMSLMCVCVMSLCMACGDDGGTTKPKIEPAQDAGVDMVAPDMSEPDMAEPDMAPDMSEPDMAEPDMEVDMAEADPMISGMWQLRMYENDAPTGEAIASFDLMNAMGSSEVLGTFSQGEAQGSVTGTYVSDTLSLEWEANAQNYQFVTGMVQGAGIVGNYNDPNLGGIPQSAILVRP